MPKLFQNVFTVNVPVHVRQKPNGVFEARFRAYGYNICVSSVHYEKLKAKFLAALAEYQPRKAEAAKPDETEKKEPSVLLFGDISKRWLELKRPTIKATSYRFYTSLLNFNLLPVFGNRPIAELRQSDVQEFINGYVEQGKGRTAVKLYQTLKAIFDFAVGDELLLRSPMRLIKPPKYEEENGRALTITEEKELLQKIARSKCSPAVSSALLFLLYTGIRRSELASAQIEDGFVRIVCAKVRKGYRERQRLIPITPMLAKHLPTIELDKIRTVRPDALTTALKRLMPEHHLHELRHTFITRCQECGVAREVVSVWAGHAADNTMTSNVYTHFSREFMLEEAEKVSYQI